MSCCDAKIIAFILRLNLISSFEFKIRYSYFPRNLLTMLLTQEISPSSLIDKRIASSLSILRIFAI